MAVVLKELIEKVTGMELEVLAGGDGTSNSATWVHMVESEAIGNFVEFGELVFTTGIALNEKDTLLKLTQKVQSKQASGLIVNIGPYIEGISKEVIDFCNEESFPLMVVPWKVNMANIMRIISFEITNKQLKDMDFEMAMKNAILYPQEDKMYLKPLQKQLIDLEASFTCIVLHAQFHGEPLKEVKLNKINYLLKNQVGYNYKNVHITTIFNNIVIVASDATKEQIDTIIVSCKEAISTSHIVVEDICYLVGEEVKGIEKLHISYENAAKLHRVKNCHEQSVDVLYYESLGVFKLLLEIENKAVIQKFYEESIRKIVEYDSYHETDLLDTLGKYLKYDGSLKAVAEEMFLHRNTVNYKLSKVESLLECNLSTQETRTKLGIGIAVYRLFEEELK
ncbi:MAG: PucR family transcriptional regulator ligand-binding domain-containing protein [Eubacteriales bacterium]